MERAARRGWGWGWHSGELHLSRGGGEGHPGSWLLKPASGAAPFPTRASFVSCLVRKCLQKTLHRPLRTNCVGRGTMGFLSQRDFVWGGGGGIW